MNKLDVINIGAFGHSTEVLRQVADTKDVNLVALAPAYPHEDCKIFTDSPAYSKDTKIFDDYQQLLHEIKPDLAIISTRLDLIPTIAIQAANAGCHLILEKPLALDDQALCNLHNAVKQNNVNLMAMLSMRAMPHYISAKQVYDSGVIGEAVLINARKSYKWGTRPKWFNDETKYGDTIGWVGIHAFDFINFITALEFTKVAAMESNFCHTDRKACQDNCALALELSNGGHATVSIDYCRPSTAPTHGDDWIRVVGTKGILEASGVTNTCKVIEQAKPPYETKTPRPDTIYKNFFLSLLTKQRPPIKTHIPFMLTDTCLKAKASAKTGKFVNIEQDKWCF